MPTLDYPNIYDSFVKDLFCGKDTLLNKDGQVSPKKWNGSWDDVTDLKT